MGSNVRRITFKSLRENKFVVFWFSFDSAVSRNFPGKIMWEVVYPTSRAVELDEEDEEEDRYVFDSHLTSPVVRLSRFLETKEGSSPFACKLFVIAFGRIATTFIEAHFLNADTQIVGLVAGGKKERDLNTLLQTGSSDKTCFIHSSIATIGSRQTEVLFCQSKVEYPAECSHGWAKEVSPLEAWCFLQQTFLTTCTCRPDC